MVFSSFDTHRHNVLARVPSQCGTKHSPCRYELGVGDLQFGSDKEHHQRFLNRALGETKFFQEIVYFANVPYRVAHWGSMVGIMEHHEHGDVGWTCGSRVEAPRAALTRKRRCFHVMAAHRGLNALTPTSTSHHLALCIFQHCAIPKQVRQADGSMARQLVAHPFLLPHEVGSLIVSKGFRATALTRAAQKCCSLEQLKGNYALAHSDVVGPLRCSSEQHSWSVVRLRALP